MRVRLLLGLLSAPLLALGCSKPCKDADGDGRGEHCDDGSDCDDHDPKVAASCDQKARACEADPFATYCPCLVGQQRDCYAGKADTAGVGMCKSGQQSCDTGVWSACEGEVVPDYEVCNGKDEDCDGLADEGVLSPCGGCNEQCNGGVWGPAVAPFVAQDETDVTALGELTLRLHGSDTHSVWVPNTGDATLSKVDAESALELARYRVDGDTPDRVAIDHNGDAWVLSPSLDGTSRLTQVAAGDDRCRAQGDDGLQTSRGPHDVLPLGQDECVLARVPVGDEGEVARALAIDGARSADGALGGDVWVGMQAGERLLALDGLSGDVMREVPTPGFAPFDATFDPWGTLWVIDRAGLLARVDPLQDPPAVSVIEMPLRCFVLDSLASDAQGVLTLTGFACENVITYDPRRDHWAQTNTSGVLDTRGVTVIDDESWVAHTAGQLSRVRRDPLAIVATYPLASDGTEPVESIAIGADSLRQLWVVSSMGGPKGAGVLTRFDPFAERVTAQVPLGRLPRALGDITGSRRLGEFAEQASASHVFDGCSEPTGKGQAEEFEPTDWVALHLQWEPADGASVLVEARHADTRAALTAAPPRSAGAMPLADASFVTLGTLPYDEPPYALPFPTGGVVEVRLTLRSASRIGAPRIGLVGIEWHCPGPD